MLISKEAIQQLQLLQERCIIYNWKSYLSEICKKEFKRRHNCHHLEVKKLCFISHVDTLCNTVFGRLSIARSDSNNTLPALCDRRDIASNKVFIVNRIAAPKCQAEVVRCGARIL